MYENVKVVAQLKPFYNDCVNFFNQEERDLQGYFENTGRSTAGIWTTRATLLPTSSNGVVLRHFPFGWGLVAGRMSTLMLASWKCWLTTHLRLWRLFLLFSLVVIWASTCPLTATGPRPRGSRHLALCCSLEARKVPQHSITWGHGHQFTHQGHCCARLLACSG